MEKPLTLGLDPSDTVLLAVTILISMLTFGAGRTNILAGVVHLMLFATFCFSPSCRDRYADMKRPVPALIAALLVMLPQAAQAATLDGAAMRWPLALPFVGLLLSIAIGPPLFPKFWHRHYGKIAAAGLLTLAAIAWCPAPRPCSRPSRTRCLPNI